MIATHAGELLSVRVAYYPPDGKSLYHRLIARDGSVKVGELRFWLPSRNLAEIESVEVPKSCRRQGVGTTLHRELTGVLHTRFPTVKYLGGKVINKASLGLRRKVHGVADFHATDLDELTAEEADKFLIDMPSDDSDPFDDRHAWERSVYVRNKI